jgi:adenylate kinase family enzyme
MKISKYSKLAEIIRNSKRINIVGSSGSGKSTFGKKLSSALNIPYIEIDQIFWGPNWYRPEKEEFHAKLENHISGDTWILDGNYSKTVSIKWKNVQTVIWLDYSFFRIMYQTIRRAISRMISQQELWPGTGNKETFRKAFFSKESIILWSLSQFRKVKNRYRQIMRDPSYSHINFIRLKSPKTSDKLLEKLINIKK